MSDLEIFERHGLTPVRFSPDEFYDGMGGRLNDAGLRDVATQIADLGLTRHFLRDSLSPDEIRTVNSSEALVAAEEAARFQERVQQVEVRESGERMDDLREVAALDGLPWTFTDTKYHPACGEWAGKERLFWTREQVTDGLLAVTTDLCTADFGLHFEDGFRPLGVQEGLFKRRYQMAKDANPGWSHDEIVLEARSKTAYTPRLAAHKGGAAVDVRVRDLRTGKLLDIGHGYPDGGALVALEAPLVTQKQFENRYLLATLAMNNGMSMYHFEDWHVCQGDTTAAAGQPGETPPPAVYGPVKRFDMNTGEILETYDQSELDEVFAVN